MLRVFWSRVPVIVVFDDLFVFPSTLEILIVSGAGGGGAGFKWGRGIREDEMTK